MSPDPLSVAKATIPLAWALSGVITLGGGFYWIATLNAKVEQLGEQRAAIVALDALIDRNGMRLTTLEAEVRVLERDLDTITNYIRGQQPPYPDFMEK